MGLFSRSRFRGNSQIEIDIRFLEYTDYPMESLFYDCFNILTIFQAEVDGEEYNITYGIITLFNFNLRLK